MKSIVWITDYYTSTKHKPVQHIAKASETGHGTNVIAGLAVGMRATVLPVVVIVLGFILWRGLDATVGKSFNCEYKLVYAVCKPKSGNPKLPSTWDILKAGVKF